MCACLRRNHVICSCFFFSVLLSWIPGVVIPLDFPLSALWVFGDNFLPAVLDEMFGVLGLSKDPALPSTCGLQWMESASHAFPLWGCCQVCAVRRTQWHHHIRCRHTLHMHIRSSAPPGGHAICFGWCLVECPTHVMLSGENLCEWALIFIIIILYNAVYVKYQGV